MPDQTGKLSKSEKDKALAWLNERTEAAPTCSVCGTQNWTVADHAVAPALFGKGLILGGVAYPHIMLVCRHCGHTLFFNAIVMGVLDKNEEKAAKAEEPETKKAEAE